MMLPKILERREFTDMAKHVPALLEEAMEFLDVRPDLDYIDATVGGGGYTREILRRNGPTGKVLGIEWDEDSLRKLNFEIHGASDLSPSGDGSREGDRALSRSVSRRLTLVQGNFAEMEKIARLHNFGEVRGVVFDLGLSSILLEGSGRGFSYLSDEPLLMTFDKKASRTAAEVVNTSTPEGLARMFSEYGEVRDARRIARRIVQVRGRKRIVRTGELTELLDRAVGRRSIPLYAKVFQALRIEVNGEMENLARGLEGAWEVLEAGGRLVVVSFHSLEDRMVKHFFRERQKSGEASVLTKKAVRPRREEIEQNVRSRSAKLRAIEKNR
jgi:16S rRNA (cytosine1402-N4)-methyltransferase